MLKTNVSQSAQTVNRNDFDLATDHPWLQEFIASAIDPAVALANVYYLDGDEALAALLEGTIAQRQKVQSYVTTGTAKLLQAYANIAAGAWFARCVYSDVPYCKPKIRRSSPSGEGPKYETPPGQSADPVFPPDLGPVGLTWDDVKADPSIPVVLCEGVKKALALITLGIPAVALRGAFQWRAAAGSKDLHPLLADLALDGRALPVAFDQDAKLKTAAAVSQQAQRLGNAIERAGGKPSFLHWSADLGKGIDDALASMPAAQRRAWVDGLLASAIEPKAQRRRATLARALNVLEGGKPPQALRETEGEYMPALPPLTPGAIHWLRAGMGSGKTTRVTQDWIRAWVASGGVVAGLTPLNSLGQQAAAAADIPHIHDYALDGDSQQALAADVSHRGGVFACVNSAHRVSTLLPSNRPLMVFIDEPSLTLGDAAHGGTLRGNWADRWEDLIALLQRAAVVVLSEAELPQETIDLARALAGPDRPVMGYAHHRHAAPWPVSMASNLSGFRQRLHDDLTKIDGRRFLLVTTSQSEGRRVEKLALELGIKTVRIDSETNEGGTFQPFFECPDTWLYANMPELLILSPSAKTGVSIEGGISAAGSYFDQVFGYFPALDVDTAMQMLGRYRPAVPRVVFAQRFVTPGPSELPSVSQCLAALTCEAKGYAKVTALDLALDDGHDRAIRYFLARRLNRAWAQKIDFQGTLRRALVRAGHTVADLDLDHSQAAVETWRRLKIELAHDDAIYHAGLALEPEHTPAWAHDVLTSTDSTARDRALAFKVNTVCKFPGLDWHDADLWFDAVFNPEGGRAAGAGRWAEGDHYLALDQKDIAAAAELLGKRLKPGHLLPTTGIKATLAHIFKPFYSKLLAAGMVDPQGTTEQEITALALAHAGEIGRYWRLNITAEQSITQVVTKIGRKFGLTFDRADRITLDGRRLWRYSITVTETWQDLVEARSSALGTNSLEVIQNALTNLCQHSPSTGGGGGGGHPNPPSTVARHPDNPPIVECA